MGKSRELGSWSYIAMLAAALLALASSREARTAENAVSGKYNVELAPLLGKNLPFDLWGVQGSLTAAGIRVSAKPENWAGAGEASTFYQAAGSDKAYTVEVAYRHEVYGALFNGFFSLGYHVSKFSLTTDYDANGNCVLKNCGNDSGLHSGFSYGGGLLIPVSELNPLKLGIRYYQNPQTWVLIEMSYGLRF
jgi:hypothetical protein